MEHEMKRSPELDFLRFVAIALVMGRHIYVCPEAISAPLHTITTVLCRVGWAGVDLFFVLSGFLISGLLFAESQAKGRINVWRFYIRRGFKIYPSFWVFMLTGLGVVLWQYFRYYRQPATDHDFLVYLFKWQLPNLLFIQNYVPDMESNLIWSVRMTWSLAIEEHFYLALPMVLLVLRNREGKFPLLPWICLAVAVACLLARLSLGDIPFTTAQHLMPTHLRIDSLLFGVLLRYGFHERPDLFYDMARRRILLSIIGVACFFPLLWMELGASPFLYTWGYTVLAIGSGSFLLSAFGSGLGTGRVGSLCANIGKHSYSIYLWHVVGAWIAGKLLNPSGSLEAWICWVHVYIGLSLLIGCTLSSLLEYPMLRLRDRLFQN